MLGGLTTYYGGRTLGEAKVLGKELGGTVVRIGPIKDPNFPWILLDRAVLHYETVLDRAHAERDVMVVAESAGKQGVSATLPSRTQSRLGGLFAKIRKNADEVPFDLRQDLKTQFVSILDERFG